MSLISTAEVKPSDDVSISDIIKPYSRKWLWFILSVITTIILGILFVKTSTPVFKIDSTVLIKDAKKSPSGSLGMPVSYTHLDVYKRQLLTKP